MALTAIEQELFDFGLAATPPWFQDDERAFEWLGAMAKMLGSEQTIANYWFDRTLIGNADGPAGDNPDWLRQHALDRGSDRQASETDVALRARIRNIPDALTRQFLIDAAQDIVDAEPVVGTVYMVELPRDSAYFTLTTTEVGTAGTTTAPDGDGNQTFTPGTAFAGVPYRSPEEKVTHKFTVSGATDPNNNGTFPVIGLVGSAVQYLNAGGSAEVTPAITWAIDRYDRDDNKVTGFDDAYFDRGDRMSSNRSVIIIILPFGSTAGTKASVDEMLRQYGAAGMKRYAEYRQIP